MIPVPLTWTLAAVVLALFVGAYGGCSIEANRRDAQLAQQAAAAAHVEAQQRIESTRVESTYAHDLQQRTAPQTIIRDRIVHAACPAAERLRQPASEPVPMPARDAGQPADAAAAPAADDRITDLAADAVACVRNAQQLAALQALIRANAPQEH